MTAPEWKSVWDLFERVNGVPDDVARAMLDSPTEDPAVVHEVRVMFGSRDADQSWPGSTAAKDPQEQYAGLSIGPYQVGILIGSGSTGEAYSGRDIELERPVAMKFISPEYSNMISATEQLIREAQAASALNIVDAVEIADHVKSRKTGYSSKVDAACGKPLVRICAGSDQRWSYLPRHHIARRAERPKELAGRRGIGVIGWN